MGKAKQHKKIRKEARKNVEKVLKEFKDAFDINDYIKPKPLLIPKFAWNILINWIFKG